MAAPYTEVHQAAMLEKDAALHEQNMHEGTCPLTVRGCSGSAWTAEMTTNHEWALELCPYLAGW